MNKIKKILIFVIAAILSIGILVCAIIAKNTVNSLLTFEEYNNLSAEEQEEYFNSFEDVEDFFAWYNKAKQEYEEEQERIEIDGSADINIGGGEKE